MFGDQFSSFVSLFQLKLFHCHMPQRWSAKPLWGLLELFSQLLSNISPTLCMVSSCLCCDSDCGWSGVSFTTTRKSRGGGCRVCAKSTHEQWQSDEGWLGSWGTVKTMSTILRIYSVPGIRLGTWVHWNKKDTNRAGSHMRTDACHSLLYLPHMVPGTCCELRNYYSSKWVTVFKSRKEPPSNPILSSTIRDNLLEKICINTLCLSLRHIWLTFRRPTQESCK